MQRLLKPVFVHLFQEFLAKMNNGMISDYGIDPAIRAHGCLIIINPSINFFRIKDFATIEAAACDTVFNGEPMSNRVLMCLDYIQD